MDIYTVCVCRQLIVCDTHLGPPSFWTHSMKVKLKLPDSNNQRSAKTKIKYNFRNELFIVISKKDSYLKFLSYFYEND